MSAYFDFQHTVTADEIDAQQHVHNLRYLQWTLWAAGAHTRACGWQADEAREAGIGWVVRNHQIKYQAAAKKGDEIIVRTWVSEIQRFASRRNYVICRPADKTLLSRVETRWVYVDLNVEKVIAVPDDVASLMQVIQSPPMPWDEAK